MQTLNFNHKALTIPNCWTINRNNFVNLEPDNHFDIDLVAHNFVEDVFQATWNKYIIDLGFYGNYDDNRKGFFKLYVIKGDFLQGTLYETFISRSTNDIKNRLDMYLDIIPKNLLENVQGFTYGDLTENSLIDFHVYSAINNVQLNLTDSELEKLSESIVRDK